MKVEITGDAEVYVQEALGNTDAKDVNEVIVGHANFIDSLIRNRASLHELLKDEDAKMTKAVGAGVENVLSLDNLKAWANTHVLVRNVLNISAVKDEKNCGDCKCEGGTH